MSKPGKNRPARDGSKDSPRLELGAVPIELERIGLRSLQYTELEHEGPVQPVPPGSQLNIRAELEVRINLYPKGAELYMEVLAQPDPHHMPVEVRAGISAFFRKTAELDDEVVLEFAENSGIRIIFPYLREVISTASMKGLYGPIWLDPMAISVIRPEEAESVAQSRE